MRTAKIPGTAAAPPTTPAADLESDEETDALSVDPLQALEQAATKTAAPTRVRLCRIDDRTGALSAVADIEGSAFGIEAVQHYGAGRYWAQVRDTETGRYILTRRFSVTAPAAPTAPKADPIAEALAALHARLDRIEQTRAAAPASDNITTRDLLQLIVQQQRAPGVTAQDIAAIGALFRQERPPLADTIEAMRLIDDMRNQGGGDADRADPFGPVIAAALPKVIEQLSPTPARSPARPMQQPTRPTLPPKPATPAQAAPSPDKANPATPEQQPAPHFARAMLAELDQDTRGRLLGFLSLMAEAPNRSAEQTAQVIASNMPEAAWHALEAVADGALAGEIIQAVPGLRPHAPFIAAVERALRASFEWEDAEPEPDAEDQDAAPDAPRDVPGQQPLTTPEGVPLVHIGHTPPPGVQEPAPAKPATRSRRKKEPAA